jgi:hypothetical protein
MDHMNALMLLTLLAAPPAVPPDGIVHVARGPSRAHACAVRDDILLTARHVAEDGGDAVAWSDLAGHDGTAVVESVDPARDLVVMRIVRGTPGRVWALAKVAPQKGDRVRIVGYDDDDRDPAKPKLVEARVVAVDAGHIDYNKSAGYGSSGGCVLNDADEVVAINHAFASGPGGIVRWGAGVSVYGEWAPTLPTREEPSADPDVLPLLIPGAAPPQETWCGPEKPCDCWINEAWERGWPGHAWANGQGWRWNACEEQTLTPPAQEEP